MVQGQSCHIVYTQRAHLSYCEVILQLRASILQIPDRPISHDDYQIYALYERSRRVLIFMLVLCAIEVVSMAVLVAVTMGNLRRECEHLLMHSN